MSLTNGICVYVRACEWICTCACKDKAKHQQHTDGSCKLAAIEKAIEKKC